MLKEVAKVCHMIVLTRPEHFNGEVTCLFGDKCSLNSHVGIIPPAKSTTTREKMNLDLIFLEIENTFQFTYDQMWCLRTNPYFTAIGLHMRCAIQWLHAGMKLMRKHIGSPQRFSYMRKICNGVFITNETRWVSFVHSPLLQIG